MFNKEIFDLLGKNKKYVVYVVILMIINLFSSLGITAMIAYSIHLLIENKEITFMIIPIILIFVFMILRYFLVRSINRLKNILGNSVKKDLRNKTYKKISKLGVNATNEYSNTTLTQISLEGIEQLDIYYSSFIPQFFYSLIAPIILFLVSVFLDWRVAVEVVLTETGFKTSIIKESIQEPEDIKIASISLYPFLGTAISVHEDYSPTTGYMVVPDGSGAVIEFNNNKLSQSGYRKRIYASDISNQRIKMPEEQEMISIPVYGMIKENIGLASIVTNGASMTFINADISEKIDSYNKIFPTIQYRENYLHTLGTGWNTYSVSLWSKGMANTDLTVEHVILRGANNNYVGIAKAYQNYLVKEEGLTKQDSPNKPKTTLELLGAYDVKAYALGVPYNKVKSLTTFKEARKITDEFSNENYDINVLFDGALNGGLRSGIQTKASFERTLGGKRGYKSLDKYLREKDIDMYLQLNVTGARSFRRAFDEYTYTAQRLNGDLTRDFQYHLPSQLPYSEAGAVGARHSADDYVLSSRYYEPIYNKIKKKIPTDNISFTKLGSNLIGSYRHSDTIYVEDTLEYTKALLQNSEKNMMLKNPLGFTFPYTKYAVDIAMDTTLFPIIDYAIPLVHLVLADYVPYASRSLNLLTQRGERFNFLKILETGSQLKYTLSYGDPKELINTEYTKYLSTYYMYWVETIKEQMDELNNLGIYEGYLISHKKVANNVYVVNYSNGLELYINYNTNPVVVNGKNVDALSYVKGGV